jgi:hypothetical protein
MYKILVAVFLVGFAWQVSAKSAPVVVGGEEGLDACPSLGVVSGLKPKKGGFLAVRSGASRTHKRIAKLREGQEVFICNTSTDGHWLGIVYAHGKATSDCGVTTPINPAGPYKGKCTSGWVNANWIKLIAG